MPRIRSIKPDCLQHRKVGRLSDRCVRVWLGMLTHADDEGRLPCDAGEVLGWCGFSYHRNVTEDQVEEAIQVIQNTHLIQTYSSNGTRYAWFPSWKDHQFINRPTPSKLPPPPIMESSVNDPGVLNGPSLTTPEGLEGIGRDRKGKNTVGFEDLWKSYPAPKGPKQDALKAFKEVHPPENVITILQIQIDYKQSCDSRGEFYPQLPHLHRWLKKRRWEDEIPTGPEEKIEYPRMEDPKTAWKTQERYREALAAGRVSPRERIPEWEPTESPVSSAVSAGSLSVCPDGVRIVAPGPSISPRSDGTPAGTG